MRPRVTVLIPVYNREQFVDEAIRSVVGQDLADLELILVDDGSTDGTADILRAWAKRDPRIVVIPSPRNQGIPSALNLGLQHARGEYVARLDSDDIMMPGRLTAQAEVLDRDPDVVLVSCAYEIVDVAGNHLALWRGDEPHEVMVYLLRFYNIVGGGGQVMFRLADVREEGGYAVAYPSSEDYDLWVRLLRRGRIVTLPLVGMKQRDHGARSIVQYAGVKRANWTAIMRRELESYLGRPVRDEELHALITVWRVDGAPGAAAAANRIMHEAFRRFRAETPSRHLRAIARRRTAEQWMLGARMYARAGSYLEAAKYAACAATWLTAPAGRRPYPPARASRA